jgi:hypothetical protein
MALPPSLPYAHLNLRRNPFGELEAEERAELAVAEVGSLVARVRRPGAAVQLLGPSGSGKTTWLLAIRRHFPGAPFVKVHERVRTRVPSGHPLFVDDAHLLPPRQRRRLLSRPISFILCTHLDLAQELAALGLEAVTVTPGGSLSAELLEVAFARRVEAARRGPGAVPRVPRTTVERLLAGCGGDVRSMELALYQAVVRLRECGDVQV